jgi:hypothetical protein
MANKFTEYGRNNPRLASVSIGMFAGNFLAAILIDQFGVPAHPNVVVTGTLLLAALVNKLVSKYLN